LRTIRALTLAATIVAATLAATPAAAQRQFRVLNPATWLNIGQQVVSSECGWIIGPPFALNGRQTQLAVQVFSGNAEKPAFLASFDASDAREIELVGAPGMVLQLRGGTYTAVDREDGLRFYLANNRDTGGWDVLTRVRRARECGVAKNLMEAGAGGFFVHHGYLVAGAALSPYQDVFQAYFAGRPEEARKLLNKAREVEEAAAKFLGVTSLVYEGLMSPNAPGTLAPPTQPPATAVVEVPSIPKGCNLKILLDLVSGLNSQIQIVEGTTPSSAQLMAIAAVSTAANYEASMCQ
jgi:hypothetical protein